MTIQTRLLSICIQSGLPSSGVDHPESVPALLIGAPGTSKTAIMQALGTKLTAALGKRFPVETIALPQIGAETLAGVPVPNHSNKTTDMYIMGVGRELINEGQGVLFLDELSSCNDAVAAAGLTVTQSGRLGDHILPPAVARVAAMNVPERAVNGRVLMAPESNRFCWIPWVLEFKEWADYMSGGEGITIDLPVLPNNWELDNYFGTQSLVIQYLKTSPSDFLNEPDPHKAGLAWPSPRSWRNATRLLTACRALGERVDSPLSLAAVTGCVGEAAGTKFVQYASHMDLPDPEEVLSQGTKFKFKTKNGKDMRDDIVSVILAGMAGAACKKLNNEKEEKKRWETAFAIIEAVSDGKIDLALDSARFLIAKKPLKITTMPAALKKLQLTFKDIGLLPKQNTGG